MANSLRLNIPAQDLVDIKTLDPHPRHLNKWLATLHLANVKESAPRVLNVLRKYNRCQMEPSARYKAMNMLHPVLDELTDTIKNKYWGNYILLAEKHRAGNNTVNPFLEETAYGYKIIIADLIGEGKNYSLAPEILIESIYQSILYLSELILTSYLVNAPEPNGVWGELNRLYHFAEQAGFHKQTVVKDSEHSERKTIYHAYKKIVLLALANPYQLMPGEAATIFNYLNDWARGCHIVPAEQGTQIKGRFYASCFMSWT